MAFNNWPYTNFQDLNLGWILLKIKEAVLKADNAYNSVGQFDSRITANTIAIRELGLNINNKSIPAKITVNSNREAFYHNEHITGAEIQSMIEEDGYFPYVVFNGKTYMPDTVSVAGDMRFTVVDTDELGDIVVIRRLLIPAQSYNAAYSIVNVGSGGGSSNALVFEITDSACNYTYAELLSAWSSGKALVANIKSGSNIIATSALVYKETVTQSGGTQIDRFTIVNPELTIGSTTIGIRARYVYSNNTVSYGYIKENIATIDTIVATVNDGVATNALLKTAQTLSAAEQAQVKQNLGISGGGASGAVLYDTAQNLTDQQKAQARDNIGADSRPLILNVTENNGTYTVDKTAAEIRANMYNLLLTFGLNDGVTIDSYQIYGSPPMHNIVFTVCDPASSSATYIRYLIQVYFAGQAPTQADDIPIVTRSVIEHNIGGGSLPAVTTADNGKFLRVVSGTWAADTVPSAESNSFGGV